jgi:hypothetical protein
MEDETIQKDVSAEAQAQDESTQAAETKSRFAPEDPRSVRERRMDEVAKRAREERETNRKNAALMNNPDLTEEEYDAQQVAATEAESGSDPDEADGAEDAGELTAGEEHAGEADDRSKGDADQKPADLPTGFERRADGVPVKKLKVNGQIVELTQEEYERHLSKDLAGDQKLRLASERERQLAKREQEIARLEEQMKKGELPDKGADSFDLDKALGEYHDAVYAGDPAAANAILKAALESGRQSSTPNLDQLVAETATRVREEVEAERHRESVQTGFNKLQEQYPELFSDKKRLSYADAVIQDVQERYTLEGREATAEEIILEAGRIAYEDLRLDKPPAPQTDAERTARKANLKPVPRAGTERSKQSKPATVDMSPAAKIARLRQGRAL